MGAKMAYVRKWNEIAPCPEDFMFPTPATQAPRKCVTRDPYDPEDSQMSMVERFFAYVLAIIVLAVAFFVGYIMLTCGSINTSDVGTF